MRILGEGGNFSSLLSPPDFGGLVSLWLTDAEVPNRREGDSGQEERADRKPLGENCSRLPRMWCGAVMFSRGRSGLVTNVEEEEAGGWEDRGEEIRGRFNKKDMPYRKCSDTKF